MKWLVLIALLALVACNQAPTEPEVITRTEYSPSWLTSLGDYSWHRSTLTRDFALITEETRLTSRDSLYVPRPILFVYRDSLDKPFTGKLHAITQGTVTLEEASSPKVRAVRSRASVELTDIREWMDRGWSFYYINAEWAASAEEAKQRFINDLEVGAVTKAEMVPVRFGTVEPSQWFLGSQKCRTQEEKD